MKRCFIPPTFGKIKDCNLHYFSDACEKGYGQVTYLCTVDESGKVYCSLVMGKVQLKYITIPRVEVAATTLSGKIYVMLRKEFQLPITREIFWTDSEAVLSYIRNQTRKFKVFVANRAEIIRENSQWFHVNTKANPADYCSRGIDVSNTEATETWFNRPSFLWESGSTWTFNRKFFDVSSNDDPELKKEFRANYIEVSFDILHQLEEKISTWDRMKRVTSWVLRFKQILQRKIKMDAIKEPLHASDLLQESEVLLTKFVQEKRFSGELKAFRSRRKM